MVIIEGHAAASHDGGVAVFNDGEIIALAAERVDRIKHSREAELSYDFLRKRINWPAFEVHDFFHDSVDRTISHPLAHAASAFYPSPFDRALILVVDGQGPYSDDHVVSLSVWIGDGLDIKELESYPERGAFCSDSLGHFYSAVTYYLGFGFYDQGKTMGLAAHGSHSELVQKMCKICRFDGQRVHTDCNFIRPIFYERFGVDFGWPMPPTQASDLARLRDDFGSMRKADEPFCESNLNLAYAGQAALEETLLALCKQLREKYGIPHLCVAGGVGLNISANSRLIEEAGFDSIFIQPAAGDDGQALGRLLFRMHSQFRLTRRVMENAYFGPDYSDTEIRTAIDSLGPMVTTSEFLDVRALNRAFASLLAEGRIAARFFGRSEIGPRALGNRSILADPRRKEMPSRLTSLKHREAFQPFALSILKEQASGYFDLRCDSPYMLLSAVATASGRERLVAGVHVDGRSRLQTVTEYQNPEFHDLLGAFHELTGIPALVNTSFNNKGEPLVETPTDAINAFRSMLDLEVLAMGRYLIRRKG